MHRVLITGDREWEDLAGVMGILTRLQRKHRDDLLIITGGARGADRLVEGSCYALGIHCAIVNALWKKHGDAAGPRRNLAMLSLEPNEVIAFHPNLAESKGTLHMVTAATRAGIRVRIYKETEHGD